MWWVGGGGWWGGGVVGGWWVGWWVGWVGGGVVGWWVGGGWVVGWWVGGGVVGWWALCKAEAIWLVKPHPCDYLLTMCMQYKVMLSLHMKNQFGADTYSPHGYVVNCYHFGLHGLFSTYMFY